MQTKLTLSIDPSVVVRAKRYARQSGVSISQMVEAYLSSVTRPARDNQKMPPVLSALRGTLQKGDREDYRRHLVAKYL